jgi:hypothetical protein
VYQPLNKELMMLSAIGPRIGLDVDSIIYEIEIPDSLLLKLKPGATFTNYTYKAVVL